MENKIRELTNFEDFKRVYSVFSSAPYYEKYTEKELEDIFQEYQEKGYIYGAYDKGDCIGLIALERNAKPEHPVKFDENDKIMYLSDIAVLDKYRRRGIGNQLMLYGVMQSKLLGYEKLYMRTLEKGSMSYGIASRIGFEMIPNIFQDIERERVNGNIKTMRNIFLELDLKSLNKNILKREISIITNKNEEERE